MKEKIETINLIGLKNSLEKLFFNPRRTDDRDIIAFIKAIYDKGLHARKLKRVYKKSNEKI